MYMDVGSFKVRLATLPFLTRTNVTGFKERANQGDDLPALLEEARATNDTRRDRQKAKKQRDFETMIANVRLGTNEKQKLRNLVDANTNVRELKNKANALVNQRPRANELLEFLKNININQANKNTFITRHDQGNSLNVLKQNVRAMEKRKRAQRVSNDRRFLKNAIGRMGLNQANQDEIMDTFEPGINAVSASINQARSLKETAGTRALTTRKSELSTLAKRLGVSNTFSNAISNVKSENRASVLKKNIERAGNEQRETTLIEQKNRLESVSRKLGTYASFAGAITRAKNKRELNAVRADVIASSDVNIANLNNLVKLKRKENAEKIVAHEKEKNKRKRFTACQQNAFEKIVRATPLPKVNQNMFIERSKVNGTNLVTLRKRVDARVEEKKETQRQKNKNAFKAYAKSLNVNMNVNVNKIGLDRAKAKVDATHKKRVNAEKERNALRARAKEISLALNMSNTNKVNNAFTNRITKEKKRISNVALQQNLNLLSNISIIETMNNVRSFNVPVPEAATKNENTFKKNQEILRREMKQKNANRSSLEAYMYAYPELTNMEKRSFMNSSSEPDIKEKVSAYVKEKKDTEREKKRKRVQAYMKQLGLTPKNAIISLNNKPIEEIGKSLNSLAVQKFMDEREKGKNALRKRLMNLKPQLDYSNVDYLMKKFTKTFIPTKRILNEADKIAGKRDYQRWAEIDEEFIDYLDTLTLKPENRRQIVSALNSYFVDFAPLKKSATNLAIQTMNAPRVENRNTLVRYINNAGMGEYTKFELLKNFNSDVSNINAAKKRVNAYKKNKNEATNTERLEAFTAFLDTLKFIPDANKKQFIERFKVQGTPIVEKAHHANTVERKRATNTFIRTIGQMGLDIKNDTIQRIISNYERFPERFPEQEKQIQNLRTLASKRKCVMERMNELKNPGTFKNKIETAVNVNSLKKIDEQMEKVYRDTLRKMVSNMVIQSGVTGINVKLANIATRNNVRNVQRQIKEKLDTKKKTIEAEVQSSNLSPENKSTLLAKVENAKMTLERMRKRIANVQEKRAKEKTAAEKLELHTFMNNLNIKNRNRNTILETFIDLNSAKANASALATTRAKEKIASDRNKVERSLQLSDENKKIILQNFNASPGDPITFETKAKILSKQRVLEKRANERKALVNHIKSVALTKPNANTIINAFNRNAKTNVEMFKKNASGVRRQRDLERVQNSIRGLLLTNEQRNTIVRNFKKNPANVNTIIERAKAKNVEAQTIRKDQSNLKNYIVSLKLGPNGSNLMKKINGPETFEGVRNKANRLKKEMNAVTTRTKRNAIRTFVDETNLNANVKNAFVTSTNLNTNVNAVKREVQKTVKDQKTNRGRLRTELKVFLTNLTNLTNREKQKLIGTVTNTTEDIEDIKNQALTMVKDVQNTRLRAKNTQVSGNTSNKELENKETATLIEATQTVAAKKMAANVKRLETHFAHLPHLTQNNKNTLVKNFKARNSKLAEILTASSTRNQKRKMELNQMDNTQRLERLRTHLASLIHLTSRDRNKFIKNFESRNTTLAEILIASTSKDQQLKTQANAIRNKKRLEDHLKELKYLTPTNKRTFITKLESKNSTLNALLAASTMKNKETKKTNATRIATMAVQRAKKKEAIRIATMAVQRTKK